MHKQVLGLTLGLLIAATNVLAKEEPGYAKLLACYDAMMGLSSAVAFDDGTTAVVVSGKVVVKNKTLKGPGLYIVTSKRCYMQPLSTPKRIEFKLEDSKYFYYEAADDGDFEVDVLDEPTSEKKVVNLDEGDLCSREKGEAMLLSVLLPVVDSTPGRYESERLLLAAYKDPRAKFEKNLMLCAGAGVPQLKQRAEKALAKISGKRAAAKPRENAGKSGSGTIVK